MAADFFLAILFFMHPRNAFTLIELAIVLVIIGLIAGGVLVGQTLIEAAKLRATVSQISSYNTAAITFKLKYNALPGDIRPTKASQFGLFTITGNCGSACPFGNNLIGQGGSPTSVAEEYIFWRHLSEAGLIQGNLNSALLQTSDGNPSSYPAGWREGISLEVEYISGLYWTVGGPSFRKDTSSGTTYTINKNYYGHSNSYSPLKAYALDSKLDDGKPNTGKMIEMSGSFSGFWDASATDGNCTYGGAFQYSADANYIADPEYATNTVACGIQHLVDF